MTAPTNGAAGVVPAVIRYYIDHCIGADPGRIRDFLLTAAAIGGLIKHNASISGAEVGCQGEVGSASAMAAAGLCAVLGGTPAPGRERRRDRPGASLGDDLRPVAGLVQVPCIERNGIGAIKAVAAASLALRGDGSHFMPLDNCIAAMRQTGEEMSANTKRRRPAASRSIFRNADGGRSGGGGARPRGVGARSPSSSARCRYIDLRPP